MESKIAKAIKLKNHPVAVLRASHAPEGALQFRPGVWGCVVAMLSAAAKGCTAAFCDETVSCPGGKVGTAFGKFKPGIEYFLSVGGRGPKPGEFYKKSPELALNYTISIPDVEAPEYLVLKPLEELDEDEVPETVVFMVNADQLSGLCTLANFDSPDQDNVQLKFGAGCVQALLYSMADAQSGSGKCTIGLTDPSARKCIDKDLLSFSIPYKRFLEMEANVEESFLTRETWTEIAERI